MSEHQGMTFPGVPFAEWPKHVQRTDGTSITAANEHEAKAFLKGDHDAVKAMAESEKRSAAARDIETKRAADIAKINTEANAALAKLAAADEEKAKAEADAEGKAEADDKAKSEADDKAAEKRTGDQHRAGQAQAAAFTPHNPAQTPAPATEHPPAPAAAAPVGGPHDSADMERKSMETLGKTQTEHQDGPQQPTKPV